eukprot:CAMPEP_0196571550 /NCGR_PEP_ID=MMETSP1081-20130531/1714_1 /TAXON_ID=36882 /ORGANISM="Pyramimonas amylifera, Strain CCMP720" /LENGTH=103 /DNA_ID=CAMNT_0041888541 /DNA_START=96 /DNA_END=407 /DNA_ORIENTATION=+
MAIYDNSEQYRRIAEETQANFMKLAEIIASAQKKILEAQRVEYQNLNCPISLNTPPTSANTASFFRPTLTDEERGRIYKIKEMEKTMAELKRQNPEPTFEPTI